MVVNLDFDPLKVGCLSAFSSGGVWTIRHAPSCLIKSGAVLFGASGASTGSQRIVMHHQHVTLVTCRRDSNVVGIRTDDTWFETGSVKVLCDQLVLAPDSVVDVSRARRGTLGNSGTTGS